MTSDDPPADTADSQDPTAHSAPRDDSDGNLGLIDPNEPYHEAQRLASIGTLSAGLAHDLGNLLLPLRLRIDSLRTMNLPTAATEDIAAIEKTVGYLQRLASGLRLLAFSPATDERPIGTTRVRRWWGDVRDLLKDALPAGVSLTGRFTKGLPAIAISPAALTQAVLNLVQNAGQALDGRSRGHVRVWAAPTDDGKQVRLGVDDDGPGLSAEAMRQCFEPFFTTRNRQVSKGLGLSLVHSVAQRAGGTVSVASRPGGGASFVLTLPAERPPTRLSRRAGHQARVVIVTMADMRLRALVSTLVHQLGARVGSLGESQPAGRDTIWITDLASAGAPTLVEEFVQLSRERHALVVGADAWPGSPDRLHTISSATEISRLRAVLTALLDSPTESGSNSSHSSAASPSSSKDNAH